MKAEALTIDIEPEVVEAVADLVMEIAFDMGIEDEVEDYGLFLRSQGLVCHNPAGIDLSIPDTQAFKRFVKRCVHEVVHIRRTVKGERLTPPVGNHWTHPEELETELEARLRVTRLSPAVNLAAVKLAGVLWARRRRQEELLVGYVVKGQA